MSRRIVISAAAGAVVLAGAGAFAFAYAGNQAPVLTHSTVRYTAPGADRAGSLTFTTDVTAPSGVKRVKVLAWPTTSSLAKKAPTAKEMAQAESALCTPSGGHTARCTYRVTVSRADADTTPRGQWYVAVLATAKDSRTTLDTKAANFTV
ncbi:DUF5707 domain-containing protein [Streptomyces sp. SLBN-31]|uniref:DUF5707 domain-containing protein n=1 Tax=Streptomyces sp. SLBN-31 TaxID=2768444 RepID=UPI00114F6656|nr:DUF5707 domain-containing protein [Streptomyces sp. SLBN-31]TQJ92571.1 hypothetical protein FBY22_3452 [Streptomyces sp. SLBN-31]